MATGDQNDCLNRIKMTLPNRWFGDTTPVLDSIVSGFAYGLSLAYSLIQYVKNQTRIATATDGFLDLISFDFFGSNLPRNSGEADVPFRQRILAALLREKGTRQGMISALTALTGRAPKIFEPVRPADTGAYGTNTMGYGVAGRYGSGALPCQAFITVYRPSNSGIPNIAGYGVSTAGYGTPSQAAYANASMITGNVTDADIFAAVDAAKPAGTIMWTQLSD